MKLSEDSIRVANREPRDIRGERGEFAVTALVLLICAGGLLGVYADSDIFWHLRIGQDILRHGRWIVPDIYSYTAGTREWVNHEWLAQLLFALADLGAGELGLMLFRGGVLAASWLLLAWSMRKGRCSFLLVALLLFVQAQIVFYMLNVQPALFTLLLITVLLVWNERTEPRHPVCYFFLFVAWSNLHGGFLLGLLVLGGLLTGRVIERRISAGGAVTRYALAVFGTLFTPFHVRMYPYLVRELTGPHDLNTHWQPTIGAQLILPLGLFLLPLLIGFFRGRFVASSLLVALAVLTVASIEHQRALPFLCPAALLAMKHACRDFDFESFALGGLGRFSLPAVFVAAAISASSGIAQGTARSGRMLYVDPKRYPIEATGTLETSSDETRVALPLPWGGYVLSKLGPGVRVAMDGRNVTLYSAEQVRANMEGVYHGDPDRFLPPEGANVALVETDTKLMQELERRGWRVTHRDSVATVLRRGANLTPGDRGR